MDYSKGFLASFFSAISSIFKNNKKRITIAFTSDLHGAIYPYDYTTGKKMEHGLAKAQTRILELRKQHKNLILLDNGDFLQGSPLNYYYNHLQKGETNPLAKIMNMMGFTAASVGNHDIEQGPEVYNKVKKELNFAWLSANATTKQGRSYFQPFLIKEIDGIKVGIVGLTTPAIPMWLNHKTYPGIHWQDMQEAAKGWAKYLKGKKQVDILIGLFHAGIQPTSNRKEWPKNIPEENPCINISKNQTDFDLIIAGHEHLVRKYDENTQALLMMVGSHAQNLGVVNFEIEKSDDQWKIVDKKAEIESLKDVAADEAILETAKDYHAEIKNYVHSSVAKAVDDLSCFNTRQKSNVFVDLIHSTQFDKTTADISLTSIFKKKLRIKKGPIRIKDLYQIYPFENNLYVLLMSGKQIKDYLEYSSGYYRQITNNNYRDLKTTHGFKTYNFDMAAGINYQIDLTKKVGNRIVNIEMSNGKAAFNFEKKYKVAVNSYRAMQLIRMYNCKILWKSDTELRNLLVDYVRSKKQIRNQPRNNWKLIPNEIHENKRPTEKS